MPEIALVGRSNVGKSSLINALVRQRIARTSAAPGKTRLANIYRVARAVGTPFYFVDLPGYGYARGGQQAAEAFDELTAGYFARQAADGLLLVDARHPGLERDHAAWQWLQAATSQAAVVATKIDKLARAERPRACREFEAVLEHPVLPVSAVTGEGLDELWILIDKLVNSRGSRKPRPSSLPRATAPQALQRQPPRRQPRKR